MADLARKWKEGRLTPEEKVELETWYAGFDDSTMPELEDETPEAVRERLYAGIEKERTRKKVIPIRRYWAAAAAVLLLLGGLTTLYISRTPQPSMAINERPAADTLILPGGNKAVLTLANGRQVILDSAKNGLLAMQGTTGVVKRFDGAITYEQQRTSAAEPLYNTVTTPRGGQYAVTLPDGTRVWLNAASSIRFPAAFTGEERLVEISGEAYLEVAPDKSKPFKVAVNNAKGGRQMEVQVLGTSFNIMAYEDEGVVKTTLLEGAIRLVHGTETKLLHPGQQGQLKDGMFRLLDDADTEEALAWKNGQTLFAGEDITAIMRKVSRWYDVDVEYQGQLPKRNFTGGISRKADISELLKILELNQIHFTVKGRKITIMP